MNKDEKSLYNKGFQDGLNFPYNEPSPFVYVLIGFIIGIAMCIGFLYG